MIDSGGVDHRWRRASVAPSLSSASVQEHLTPVVFKGTGAYLVTGPESRQVYCFSASDPEQMIDARDAEALLNTGLFRVKG